MEDAKPATALFERDVAAGNSCYSLPPGVPAGRVPDVKNPSGKENPTFS